MTYLDLLPKDIKNIIDKYRIENNPNNKFLEELNKLGYIFKLSFYSQSMYKLPNIFHYYKLPIITISQHHQGIKITGNLPFITDEVLILILRVLAKNIVEVGVINMYLRKYNCKYFLLPLDANFSEVIEINKFHEGKLENF